MSSVRASRISALLIDIILVRPKRAILEDGRVNEQEAHFELARDIDSYLLPYCSFGHV